MINELLKNVVTILVDQVQFDTVKSQVKIAKGFFSLWGEGFGFIELLGYVSFGGFKFLYDFLV